MSFIFNPISTTCTTEDHHNFILLRHNVAIVFWPIVLGITTVFNVVAIVTTINLKSFSKNLISQLMISKYSANIASAFAVTAEDLDEVINGKNINCTDLRIIYFFQVMSATGNVLTVFALAVLRIHKLKKPQNNRLGVSVSSKVRIYSVALFVWGTSFIVSLIPTLTPAVGVLALPYAITLAVITATIIADFAIFCIVKKHGREQTQNAFESLQKTERTIIVSSLLFIFAWLPATTAGLVHHFLPMKANPTTSKVIIALYKTALLHPFIEPLILMAVSGSQPRQLLRRLFCKNDKQNESEGVNESTSGLNEHHLPAEVNHRRKSSIKPGSKPHIRDARLQRLASLIRAHLPFWKRYNKSHGSATNLHEGDSHVRKKASTQMLIHQNEYQKEPCTQGITDSRDLNTQATMDPIFYQNDTASPGPEKLFTGKSGPNNSSLQLNDANQNINCKNRSASAHSSINVQVITPNRDTHKRAQSFNTSNYNKDSNASKSKPKHLWRMGLSSRCTVSPEGPNSFNVSNKQSQIHHTPHDLSQRSSARNPGGTETDNIAKY